MTPPPFPFVVGCQRSGTTLLRAMLDAHPELAIPYDSFFIVPLARHLAAYVGSEGFEADQFVDDLWGHWQVRRWRIDIDDVRAAVRQGQPATFPDAVRVVFGAYAASRGKPRFGDKTPSYLPHLPLISELLPEARFVHLIRDGRDVALSWLGRSWGPTSLPQAAMYWAANIEAGRRAGAWLGPARYREVRYERLVDDPETTLRDLVQFIELPYDASMLGYRRDAAQVVASDPHPSDHLGLYRPPTAGMRDWQREMTGADVEQFEAIAGDVLATLGYPRAT